jgi:hypothetical protein
VLAGIRGGGGRAFLFDIGGGWGIDFPGIDGGDGMDEVEGEIGQSGLRHLYESDAWNRGKFTLVFCSFFVACREVYTYIG